MADFNNSTQKLDSLIETLEANTGGQLQIDKDNIKGGVEVSPSIPKDTNIEEQTEGNVKVNKKNEEKYKKINAEKKEKKQKKGPKEKQPQEKKDQIGPQMFSLIDMRIGEIIKCWKHIDSDNLYCEEINIGHDIREIGTGLQKHTPIEEMKGKVVVMANLKARSLGGFLSNGMVICASDVERTKFEILRPNGNIGERLFLQGYEELFKSENILPILNQKKKILEKCLPLFQTDAQGFVVWNGIRVKTNLGYIQCKITHGSIS